MLQTIKYVAYFGDENISRLDITLETAILGLWYICKNEYVIAYGTENNKKHGSISIYL